MRLQPEPLHAMRARIEVELAVLLPPAGSSAVGDAMRLAVLGPGKRMRPLLVLLTAEALGATSTTGLLHAACAVELVHAASLVLDDLPCMDDARLRRGQPAVHVVHGQAVAVLAAVALLALSVQVLARAPALDAGQRCRLAAVLHDAIGPHGLVLGQARDLQAECSAEVDDLKTGVLFAAALQMGAIAAGRPERLDALQHAGLQLGRVFQLRDDLDDLAEDAARFGSRTQSASDLEAAAAQCMGTLHRAIGGPSRLENAVQAYFGGGRTRPPVMQAAAPVHAAVGASA